MSSLEPLFCQSYERPKILLTDSVTVAPYRFSYNLSEESVKEYANEINLELLATGKDKVVFCQESEGMPLINLKSYNKTVKYLNIPIDNVSILTGAANTIANAKYYASYAKEFGWTIKNFYFTNSWENSCSLSVIHHLEFHNSLNNKFNKRTKKALYMVRMARPHRLSILTNLLEQDLMSQCYVSCYGVTEPFGPNSLDAYLPDTASKIVETINNNIELFPMSLSLNQKNDNIFNLLSDREYYENSYFSIIPESKFFDDGSLKTQEITLKCNLFSEKTYKAISGKHPFVLAGIKGSLECLRSFGYKTFHPYIDESYDLIEDDEERLNTINKEITRLINLTDEQWEELYIHLLPIVHHNHEVLKLASMYVANKIDCSLYQ